MKVIKHNLIVVLLLCASVGFSQTRTQKSTESFNVKSDVIVEINTHNSDVTVEHWNKDEVLVETVLSVDGVSVEDSKEIFSNWEIEALGNSSKVVINSKSNFKHGNHNYAMDFGDLNISIPEMDFDFNFEPVIAYALNFDSLNYPAPPEMPEAAVKVLRKIEWDQEAYEKDKDGYLKKWEKEQEKWEKEIEEKYEPMMEEYEKKMEKWAIEFEAKYEPKMEAYEKEMKKWEIEFEEKLEPKMKAFEKEIKIKEKEIEKKVIIIEKKIKDKEERMEKLEKKIIVKIPKGAKLDVRTHGGSVVLPKNAQKI